MRTERAVEEDDIELELFKNEYMSIENHLKQECIISSEHRPTKGKPRGKQIIPLESFPDYNEKKESDFLVGEAALTVEDCPEHYIFKKVLTYSYSAHQIRPIKYPRGLDGIA